MPDFVRRSITEAKLSNIKQIPHEFIQKAIDYARQNFNYPNPPSPNFAQEHMRLLDQIQRKQQGHQEELTKIGLDLIEEFYGDILDGVEVDARIVNMGDPEQTEMVQKMAADEEEAQEQIDNYHQQQSQQDDDEGEEEPDYGSDFDIDNFREPDENEVAKRKILNTIQQGEAQNVHSMIRGAQDKIDAIAPGLTDDYLRFLDLNRTFDWFDGLNLGMAKNAPQFANANEVSWEGKGKGKGNSSSEEDEDDAMGGFGEEMPEGDVNPKIKAVALDLPIMIHEVVKGIYELISANAIDEDALKAQGVMAKTDTLQDEKEDIKFGPFLAAEVRDFVNDAISQVSGADEIQNIREFVFGRMVELPAEEFLDLIEDILTGKNAKKDLVVNMVQEIKEELNEWEYNQAIGAEEEGGYEEEGVQDDELQRIMQQSGIGTPKKEAPPQPQTQPAEKDYSKMSQSQLQSELDAAIDDERYEDAQVISQYLKESENILKNKLNSL